MTTTSSATSGTNGTIFDKVGGRTDTSSGKSTASELEDRFLTLLMAQVRSQDPLNPMDNAEFTSQLAQLNTVNGIEKLNTTLSSLLAGYNEAQGMQAAGIIGKNVMVAGNKLPLANAQSVGGIELASAADTVTLTIKDASGKVVQTESLGEHAAGSFYFAWDGKDADGKQLADGNYTFSVEAQANGKKVDAKAMQIGTVNAVVRNGTGFMLDLGSMGEVSFSDVARII